MIAKTFCNITSSWILDKLSSCVSSFRLLKNNILGAPASRQGKNLFQALCADWSVKDLRPGWWQEILPRIAAETLRWLVFGCLKIWNVHAQHQKLHVPCYILGLQLHRWDRLVSVSHEHYCRTDRKDTGRFVFLYFYTLSVYFWTSCDPPIEHLERLSYPFSVSLSCCFSSSQHVCYSTAWPRVSGLNQLPHFWSQRPEAQLQLCTLSHIKRTNADSCNGLIGSGLQLHR